MNFSNPTTRFFIGCVMPILLEIFIYETYLYLKPDYSPDFIILIIILPMLLPLIFFYFISPYFIFYATQSGRYYREALNKSIDDIFITESYVLNKTEVETIKSKLTLSLIPALERRYRSSYVNSYFTQLNPNTHNSEENSLLNFYETIFLFSFFSMVFSLFNAFIVLYSSSSPVIIERILIIDRIENQTNVVIYALLMSRF